MGTSHLLFCKCINESFWLYQSYLMHHGFLNHLCNIILQLTKKKNRNFEEFTNNVHPDVQQFFRKSEKQIKYIKQTHLKFI